MQIFKQKCHQKEKILFPDFVQEMGEKIHGNGILDAETRKKDEEKAFLEQQENNIKNLLLKGAALVSKRI